MRLIQATTAIAVVMTVYSHSGLAQGSTEAGLPNFVAGTYSLQEGTEEQCGTGDFELRDGGSNVAFGVYHGFDTSNKSEKITADIPDYAGCVYDTKDSRLVEGERTKLIFEEKLVCKQGVRHTLTKTAVVTKDKVTIDVTQKGNAEFKDEPTYGYRCVFTLDKPAKSKK